MKFIFIFIMLLPINLYAQDFYFKNNSYDINLKIKEENPKRILFSLHMKQGKNELNINGVGKVISNSENDEDIDSGEAYHSIEYLYMKNNCTVSIRLDQERTFNRRVFLKDIICKGVRKEGISDEMLISK